MATPISGSAQKYFLWDAKGKLYSKFREDRSKTGLTILAVIADGRTPDGRTDGHAKAYITIAIRLRYDYDTTTTNRVEWKQARAIRRSRIAVES